MKFYLTGMPAAWKGVIIRVTSRNNKVVYSLFSCFEKLGFSVLRFNFRSVGRSQGEFEDGPGELSDATVALDWLQSVNPEARQCWIAGYSFGAWIGLQ